MENADPDTTSNTDTNERIILAIGRIERALSKVETANISAGNQDNEANEALEARHNALKEELKQAIGTIDGLIAKQSEGAA